MIINKKNENIIGKKQVFTIEHFNVNCIANKNKDIKKEKNKFEEKKFVGSFNIKGFDKINIVNKNNLIEKNKKLALKLKNLLEENKKQSELQNKYNQLIIEKNDLQKKLENIINNNKNIVNKIKKIEKKTNKLIFQNSDHIDEKTEETGDLKNLLKFVYMRYFLLKKKKINLNNIEKYCKIYLNQINKLKEVDKQKKALEKKYLNDIVIGKMMDVL